MGKENLVTTVVAGRYARALFLLADEKQVLADVYASLKDLVHLFGIHTGIRRLFTTPLFSLSDQKRGLAVVVEKQNVPLVLRDFLMLLLEKGRFPHFLEIVSAFTKLMEQRDHIVRADVTIAQPLSPQQEERLKEALLKVSHARDVKISFHITPAIIGGLSIRLGSWMIDTTLRTKLNRLRTSMKEVG